MARTCRLPLVVWVLATLSAADGPGAAQVPRLVKDLNTGGAGSGAFLQDELDGFVYLVASDPDHGTELWKTDGSAQGTALVKDVWPGPTPSDPFFVVAAGGKIFFQPDHPEFGKELWASDGTEAGTVLVKDINPGPAWSFPERFAVVGDRLFFVAGDGVHGRELWVSDGTEAGTRLVKDILVDDFGLGPLRLTASADRVFFQADDGAHGEELWVSDGTEAGTRMVKDIFPGELSSSPDQMFDWNGTLYFSAFDRDHGEELWVSDGTEEGTVLVRDIRPGDSSSFPYDLTAVGGAIFFQAEDAEHGAELWRTDGTEEGTVLVADVNPGRDGASPFGLTEVAGSVFFFVIDFDQTDEFFRALEFLWISDGTEAGTRRLREVGPSRFTGVFEAIGLAGELLFSGSDSDGGVELWASDGTEAGTALVRDIFPGENGSFPGSFVLFGGRALFSASDAVHGQELWSTDGTESGTELVRDINSKGTIDGGATQLVELDGVLYFAARDGESGRELWRSDGTAAGTFMVRDINPDGDGFPDYSVEIVAAGGKIFFLADDGVHGLELWVSDGSRSGTRLVEELVLDESDFGPFALTATENRAYFSGFIDLESVLWRSDGTPEGTVEIYRGRQGAQPLAALGSILFFDRGSKLWRTDGTSEGTFKVAGVSVAGGFKVAAGERVAAGDLLFFTPDGFAFTDDNEVEHELWVTDGTRGGTRVVKDIAPGRASSFAFGLAALGERVFFRADDGVHGSELWVSDGTVAGTFMVRDIARGPSSSRPLMIGAVRDEMYFVASFFGSDPLPVDELWVTDGTHAGTRFVSRTVPELGTQAAALGDELYFPARIFDNGGELWKSDGTRKGTKLVVDLLPGRRDARPRDLTTVGRNLFFSAASDRYGRELWVVGAGTSDGVPGMVTSLRDVDGLGGDEIAALVSTLVVRDGASGEEISRSLPGPDADWEAVDFEPMIDLNGNGSAELAILARRRNRVRIFVRDALTGELVATVRLKRNRHPLDLEVFGGAVGEPPHLAILTRRGLAGRARLTVRRAGGAVELDVELARDLEALDLEVTPALTPGGRPALVVLGQAGDEDRGRLLAIDPVTGGLAADVSLPEGLVPLDLEIVQSGPRSPGLAAVLAEREKNGAARVLVADLATGETVRTVRFGKSYRALDLEPAPSRMGSRGPIVSVLSAARSDREVRITSRDALTGRKIGRAVFPGLLLPLELVTLRDLDGAGSHEAGVLGEANCADGVTAVVVRDAETGSRLGCYPMP